MRKKLLPLGRLFESAWYNPILKAVPMSMGILMSGNAGYAIAGNMSDNVVIVQQQTISVTGTVIDASGEPLVGVNIVEAGTVNGVISDFEGKFTLNVKPNATLKISYIGYIAQNILVKGQKNLTITLQEDTETLDEVVVVGYGTVRKADLAGSVSVLDSRNFKDNVPHSKLLCLMFRFMMRQHLLRLFVRFTRLTLVWPVQSIFTQKTVNTFTSLILFDRY